MCTRYASSMSYSNGMYRSLWVHVSVYGIKQSFGSVLIKNSECLREITLPEPTHAGQGTTVALTWSVVGLSQMLMPPSSLDGINYNDHPETVCGICFACQKNNLTSFQPENKLLLNSLILLKSFIKF